MHWPLLFQRPSMCIYLSGSFLLQLVVFHRFLSYDTSAQKLCDICSSILYVLNCSCPAGYFYLWPCRLPPFADCWRRNHSYYSKRRFFFHFLPLKLFWSHRHHRWYLLHNRYPPTSRWYFRSAKGATCSLRPLKGLVVPPPAVARLLLSLVTIHCVTK